MAKMMPITEGQIPQSDHQVDYKTKYKALKKKLKFLVYFLLIEQECFLEELRKAQRKLLKVSRDRSFLLDRLLEYEKIDESSGDSDATASSDSEADGQSAVKRVNIWLSQSIMISVLGSIKERKKSSHNSGQFNFGSGSDSTIFGGLSMAGLTPGGTSSLAGGSTSDSARKRPKSTGKKPKGGKVGQMKNDKSVTGHMTREELERHLESRQHAFGIEKTPTILPNEIFMTILWIQTKMRMTQTWL
ncbi:hypothetical protein KUTeg_009724 [Tegillarca granosa]|uniref:INO80 complex subunit E N-terminal domain-containing protein n=1 Tax=Tegillarca granosa TaxID=220873 RepID=A0ABQ9F4Q6_TEGGR|nr:hypothetical protein KUTeg_009724 [Tegillarca granosa]